MLDLRFPRFWLGIGSLLVAAVCLGSLLPMSNVAASIDDKLLHFLSYFVLTVWFCGLFGRVGNYVLVAAIVIALGAALDAMQAATSWRQFDLLDIVANAAGALVGFVLAIVLLGGWCSRVERWIER